MPAPSDFVYPQPHNDDDDDVVWALQAGAVEWQRGAHTDALVWLRRAIEAANAAGNAFRASEIQAALDELAEIMWRASEPPPAPKPNQAASPPATLPDSEIRDVDLADDEVEAEDLTDEALVAEEAWLDDDESRDSLLFRLPKVPTSDEPDSLDDLTTVDDIGSLLGDDDAQKHESLLPDLDRYSSPIHVGFQEPEPDTDINAIVASVPSPGMDLGNEPIDQAIASALESDAPRFSLRPSAEHRVQPAPAQAKPMVDGVPLGECLGFEDLPEETQAMLAGVAKLERLRVDEELATFGAALVTHGAAAVVSEISDEPALLATKGDVVFTEGSLADGTKLRVVSTRDDTVVAVWSHADLEQALSACPWVHETLQTIADRFQALAGATLGILGERLDASLRRIVIDRMEVRAYAPGEIVIARGAAIPGLYIVGAGRVDLVGEDEQVKSESLPGDFLFPEGVLSALPAPAAARAGAKGALLLVASRSVAHELVTSVPPLLEALVS